MKKLKFVLLGLCFSLFASSQVGQINQINIVSFTVKNSLPGTIDSWMSIPGALVLVAQKVPSPMVLPEPRLVIQIRSNGAVLCGNTPATARPVDPFDVRTFNTADLTGFLTNCHELKEGSYTICAQFFNVDKIAISREVCKDFRVEATNIEYAPPTLITPENEKKFTVQELQGVVMFRWTPLVPKPKEPVTYRLKVWQLMQGQTGAQAMRTNQPIISKDVDNITQTTANGIITGPCKLPYLCDFIWNVQAFNREGKPIGGNNGTSEAFIVLVNQGNEELSIITLLTPANGSIILATDNPNFTWKHERQQPGPASTYKIKIVEIIGEQSPEDAMRSNKPHFEKDSLREQFFQYPSSAPDLAGKKYAWNVSIYDRWGNHYASTASMFSVNSCDVNLILKLKSVECLPPTSGNNNYKICMSATYNSSIYNLTYSNAGSGFRAYHPSISPNYPVSNLQPALQVQKSGSSTTVNYCFDISVPAGQTAIKVGLQGDDKDPGLIVCQPGAELDIRLPNCATSQCECGEWGPLLLQNAAGSVKYKCGKEIPWKCNQPFNFSSSYQCNPNTDNCKAKVKWTITKEGNVYTSGTGTTGAFTPTANGTYTITLDAECNGIKCRPCTYTIVVQDCDKKCDCGTWGPLVVDNKKVDCGSRILWNCKRPFQFTSSYQCNPNDESCQAKTTWEIKKGDVIIKTGTGTNNLSDGLDLTANGTYTLTLNATCNGIKCRPCTYTIVIEDCDKKCDCGTWGPLVVDNKKVDCGSRILWNCKRPFQITSSYQCNPNDESCQAKTTWEIKKAAVIVKTGTGTNNISDAISLTANGIYTLTLNATCNDIKCKPCTYTMIVEDCKEEETCECGTWGPLVVDNKKVDCGSRILWNCKRPFQFTSSYQCNPNDESCQSKRTWELKKGAVIIKTGSGINDLSDGFDLTAEGTYTLTLNATCNGIKCRPCTYTIVVEDCDKKVEPIQNTVLKYYYDLDKDPTYPYSEISNKTLNVQFVNNYASIESIQLNIYDVESKKLINPRTVNAHKLKGFNGLNRISIDLKDYNLEQGRLYLLVVSDFSSTYHFNFKITNDREK